MNLWFVLGGFGRLQRCCRLYNDEGFRMLMTKNYFGGLYDVKNRSPTSVTNIICRQQRCIRLRLVRSFEKNYLESLFMRLSKTIFFAWFFEFFAIHSCSLKILLFTNRNFSYKYHRKLNYKVLRVSKRYEIRRSHSWIPVGNCNIFLRCVRLYRRLNTYSFWNKVTYRTSHLPPETINTEATFRNSFSNWKNKN